LVVAFLTIDEERRPVNLGFNWHLVLMLVQFCSAQCSQGLG